MVVLDIRSTPVQHGDRWSRESILTLVGILVMIVLPFVGLVIKLAILPHRKCANLKIVCLAVNSVYLLQLYLVQLPSHFPRPLTSGSSLHQQQSDPPTRIELPSLFGHNPPSL